MEGATNLSPGYDGRTMLPVSSLLKRFVGECFVFGKQYKCRRGQVYQLYKRYAEFYGVDGKVNKNGFNEIMKTVVPKFVVDKEMNPCFSHKLSGVDVYMGMTMRESLLSLTKDEMNHNTWSYDMVMRNCINKGLPVLAYAFDTQTTVARKIRGECYQGFKKFGIDRIRDFPDSDKGKNTYASAVRLLCLLRKDYHEKDYRNSIFLMDGKSKNKSEIIDAMIKSGAAPLDITRRKIACDFIINTTTQKYLAECRAEYKRCGLPLPNSFEPLNFHPPHNAHLYNNIEQIP